MKSVLVGKDEIVGPWVCQKLGTSWSPGRARSIGLVDTHSGLLAGVLYENFNGVNVMAHIAAQPGKHWLTREFLWFIFYYPFVQLGAKRITGVVESSNSAARRFDEHLGFRLEATLKDAHPNGDLLFYVMRREDCRWLNIKRNLPNGRTC